jgi:uncharacterized protein (TIGR00730 family)
MSTPPLRSVCVFCGGNPGARASYAEAARRLGEAIAARGLGLVYGGASVGLMRVVADAVLKRGGEARGVLPTFLQAREIAKLDLTALDLVDSMHARKARMADLADAFVALPGGYGTMDELFEILTWAQLGLHKKPIALLNVDGYYDGLLAFLDHAAREQLVKHEHRAMLLVDTDAESLIDRFGEYDPPVVAKWIEPSQT